MNMEDSPGEITLSPPFVAATQFDEFVAFLSALGYQIVTVCPAADGFGGEVVVRTDHLFCPCCAVAISLAQLQDGGKCQQCRHEDCISAAGEVPSGHGRFAYLFCGGPFKGRIVTSSVKPLFIRRGKPVDRVLEETGDREGKSMTCPYPRERPP
jgi:hypothetical protein